MVTVVPATAIVTESLAAKVTVTVEPENPQVAAPAGGAKRANTRRRTP
jgi:hypothetical protein